MALLSRMLPLALLATTLGGCYSYMNEHHHPQAAASAPAGRVPPARITGPAVACIALTDFGETRVRDERTIDFLAPTGRRGWRNTLPDSCPGLGFEQAFSFETSLTRLCSTDIIHVIQHDGAHINRGAACGLGQFTPVELPER
ncbi:MAG TPA: hypothetical protein VI199_03980 [Novosphingobium sp.]